MSGADVSLLVCTRDRARRLPPMLAALGRALDRAAADGLAVEVVLVDNGSRDDTAAVLAGWAATRAGPVVRVSEPAPGLSRARNAAIAGAGGRILALTDDDCLLHPGYFAALADAFARARGPAVIGGRILPGDPADLPVTVKLEDHAMALPPGAWPGGFVMGANLAFGRDVAGLVGRFDERFGAGARYRAAEDTDFLFRAQRLGVPVRYEPWFAVDHHHGRRDPAAVARLLAGYGFGDGAVYAKHLPRDRRVATAIARDVGDLRRDLGPPVCPGGAVRRFYAFRLRHKAAGFLAYLRHG